jgi:hypothetical protein
MRQKSPVDLSILTYGINPGCRKSGSPNKELSSILSMEEKLDMASCASKEVYRLSEVSENQVIRNYRENEKASVIKTSRSAKRNQSSLSCSLVEPENDAILGSEYELILFSQMEMTIEPMYSFRCKHCPVSASSTFQCTVVDDLKRAIKSMEHHLLECFSTPRWLINRIKESKLMPHNPSYQLMSVIWKRLLLHFCSCKKESKRVKFAENICQELIIPSRGHVAW